MGAACATFEEAFAAKTTDNAHILEVVHTDARGQVKARWWEVSEGGSTVRVRVGDIEQKALTRVRLAPGDHIEMRGTSPPWPQGGGCDVAIRGVVRETGAFVTSHADDREAPRFDPLDTPGFGPTRITMAAELISNLIIEKAQWTLAEDNRRLLATEVKRQGIVEHLRYDEAPRGAPAAVFDPAFPLRSSIVTGSPVPAWPWSTNAHTGLCPKPR